MKIIPGEIPHPRMHHYLLHAIAPRPIAFVSTIDLDSRPNLSPFSFFNAFGVNPTTLIFSPSRRGRDNTTKNTFDNILDVPEAVINVVTYEMVNQTSLASTEYPKGVDEFVKAGLTKEPSERVKPFRVKESPVQIECKVRQVIETGDGGGAANLVICEVLIMHVSEDILDKDGMIDQQKISLVGRLGGNYYVKGFGNSLFEVEKPLANIGIGIDALPEKIKLSKYLSGNDLGKLGNLESEPTLKQIEVIGNHPDVREIIMEPAKKVEKIHQLAKKYLDDGKTLEAFAVLMLLD
jgi:flavin reductase (DIM6/NTAB) family NADH-FMN oxidoreductase RutF